jgi:hypothetical protein
MPNSRPLRFPYQPGDLRRWRQRLMSGILGEDPTQPGTWKLDALWSAAAAEKAVLDARGDPAL